MKILLTMKEKKMKTEKILNVVLSLAKRKPDGFTRHEYYRELDISGLKSSSAYTFYLTHMKKAGYINNYEHGVWRITESGRQLHMIDHHMASKIMDNGKKKFVKNTKVVQTNKPEKIEGKIDVTSLILEIKKVNPRADISSFAAML